MLDIVRLTAHYPEQDERLLGPLSLSLAPAEWHLLAGANGSGKSTLLLAVSGALTHHLGGRLGGHISANGQRLEHARWGEWIQRVAFLPQDSRYQLSGARLTVEEEIAFPLENTGVPRAEMRQRVGRLMEQFGISDLARRLPSSLSGGEQQRVALAATLAIRPSFLLLDDPCSQLDPEATGALVDRLEALRASGLGLMTATAQVEPFTIQASTSSLLHQGELLRRGETRAIVTAPDLAGFGPIPPSYAHLAHLAHCSPPWPLTLTEAEATFKTGACVAPPPPPRSTTVLPPTLISPTPTQVRLAAVSFAYPGSSPVLHDISARVEPGQITALVGPNGAGKSTLAHTLNGLLRPQRGTVTVGRRPVGQRAPHQLARQVGYLFQEPLDQLFNPTVRDEVSFAPRQLGLRDAPLAQRVEDVLALTSLDPVAGHHPYDLTPITQRWVALASILAQGASVLVLDEPARGMDAHHRQRLVALLQALRYAGYTLLLISHDMTLVAELADRVLHLIEGHLRADAPPSDFFAATPALRPPVSHLAHRLGFGANVIRRRELLHRLQDQ